MNLEEHIRIIENFPKAGISFKDITPLLKNQEAYSFLIDRLADNVRAFKPDLVVGPEARGFVIGAPLAYVLGCGFVPLRRPGKLPYETISIGYGLEYGSSEMQIHKDAIEQGQRVVVADDLLATGGTALAGCRLVEQLGGEPAPGVGFALGLERAMAALKAQEKDVESDESTDLYVLAFPADNAEVGRAAFTLTAELRRAGFAVEQDLLGRSMKAQMKYADKLGAPYVLILGEQEVKENRALVREMARSEQVSVPLSEVKKYLLSKGG